MIIIVLPLDADHWSLADPTLQSKNEYKRKENSSAPGQSFTHAVKNMISNILETDIKKTTSTSLWSRACGCALMEEI